MNMILYILQAFVTLAKMMTIITLVNAGENSELYSECKTLCATWLWPESVLQSWLSAVREGFE